MARIYKFGGCDLPSKAPRDGRTFREHHVSDADIQARLGMTEFRDFREMLREETVVLSRPFRGYPLEYPPGFQMRATRVSFANYLLDTLGKMLEIASKRHNDTLLRQFDGARAQIKNLLDERYLTKSADEIKAAYLDFERAFTDCASRCGISVLEPEQAVVAYNKRLAMEVNRINGVA